MHANATLTPLMRAQMVREILAGSLTLRAAAAARSVSEKTARKWVRRAREEGWKPRLEDHPSVPRHQPRKTSPQLEARVVELRRQRRSYAQILTLLPTLSKATLSRVLRRHGLNRLSSLEPPPPPIVRYE